MSISQKTKNKFLILISAFLSVLILAYSLGISADGEQSFKLKDQSAHLSLKKSELYEGNVYVLTPDMLFDTQTENIYFVDSAKSQISRIVKAQLINGRIYLNFQYRGQSRISFYALNDAGEIQKFNITVECFDLPKAGFWNSIVISVQKNSLLYISLFILILFLIILLISILVILARKRKIRREIEVILETEAKMEEEMLRLAVNPLFKNNQYNTYNNEIPELTRSESLLLNPGKEDNEFADENLFNIDELNNDL